MKKSWLFLAGLLLLALPPRVQAQCFTYTTNNGAITITNYTCSGGAVTIPSTINGYPVTSIGGYAFQYSTLTSVTIPNSVTNIGYFAFNTCSNLAGITIGANVTSIGPGAFNQCFSLTNITIPNSVTSIGDAAFDLCWSLTSVTIGTNVASIGANAFGGTALNSVAFPGSLTSIGSGAFAGCSKLTGITIPAGVTNIGDSAFAGCSSLAAIGVSTNDPAYSSLNGVLFDKSQTTIVQCPGATHGSYTIPNTVNTIEGGAFNQCSSLNSVIIPASVTSIGDGAFFGCASLNAVYFQGTPPNLGGSLVFDNTYATVYYLPGTPGWGPALGGLPTEPWFLPSPLILSGGPGFGVQTNKFSFTISWTANTPVVVEACTNLANPVWLSIATNTLAGGASYFNDAQWTNYHNRFYRLAAATNTATTPVFTNGMALIRAGSFTMGDSLDGETDAVPTGAVYVSAFYMDTNLVTYSLWTNVYQWATSHGYSFDDVGAGKAGNHPVQTISWFDSVKWCNARSEMGSLAPCYYTSASQATVYRTGDLDLNTSWVNWGANGYRLPTEAEWEKAARGGLSGLRFPWGNTISESQANYDGNTATNYDLGPTGFNAIGTIGGFPPTSPVGSFPPNGYGLYDMAGNVSEWCWDPYETPYSGGSDPRGPAQGLNRVQRSGGWNYNAYYQRCASRFEVGASSVFTSYGFRCVRGHLITN